MPPAVAWPHGDIDIIADFDAIADIDSLGGITLEGTALFNASVNLGSAQRVRLTPMLLAQVNTLDQWDSRAGSIDSWSSVEGVVGGESDAWFEYRFTTDDPSGSPVYSEWMRLDATEAYFWVAQIRLRLK